MRSEEKFEVRARILKDLETLGIDDPEAHRQLLREIIVHACEVNEPGYVSFAKIRSCRLSSKLTRLGSYQSDSWISGSSQTSTNIELRSKSNRGRRHGDCGPGRSFRDDHDLSHSHAARRS